MIRNWGFTVMPFSNFQHASKEAWISLSRGGLMSFIAATTIAISMFVLGIFMLIFFNLNNVLHMLHSKLDVVAYINPKVDQGGLEEMNIKIAQLPGVKKIDFVSKEAAWNQLRENYGNLKLDSYVENNPLPDAFRIEVKDLTFINNVALQVGRIQGVDDVRYGGDIAQRVAQFTKYISYFGLALIFLLSLATIMIVINTIRLTVIARENEINIMSLVGATKNFIKRPFILEGFYLGLLGSFVSVVFLKLGYNFAILNIEKSIPFLPINLSGGEVNIVFLIVFATGLFLGMLGGYVSVSKSLKTE